MKLWFQKRMHPKNVLDEELVKVRFSDQVKTSPKKVKGIPLAVTYHPIPQALNSIIKRNSNWLYADNEVKNLLSPGPMVSFWGARKLSSCLVSAKKVFP